MSEISDRKVCTKCLENKLYSQYSKNKRTRSGYSNFCTQCLGEYAYNRRKGLIKVKPNSRTRKKQIEDVVTEWIPHVKTVSWRSGRFKDVVHTTFIHQETLKETEGFFLDEADLEIKIEI